MGRWKPESIQKHILRRNYSLTGTPVTQNKENDMNKIKDICNLENISFVHSSGHIAGSNTIIDAIKLCDFVLNKN